MAKHARGKDFQMLRNAHEFNHQDPESDHAPDSSNNDKPVGSLLNNSDSSNDDKPIGCLIKKSRMTKDTNKLRFIAHPTSVEGNALKRPGKNWQ
jgi:hypothetical protein